MSLTYGSPSWNTDSAKIDTAFLVLKDKATGKIVQIQLEETEPDSSQFSGRFSVGLGESSTLEPEIYVPPADMRGGEKDYRKLYDAISSNKLPRRPVIWKKNDKGETTLDVYDTAEQAQAALKAYQEENRIAQEMKSKKLVKPVPSESALAAAKQAEHAAALQQMALEAAKREAERVRLEQIERQKAEERERAAKALSEKEKAERRAKARKLADEASAHYSRGEYPEAEGKFKQAADLDPEDKTYFFKYGATLYRNQKFNEAIVALKTAKVDPKGEAERKYFIGLSQYRLGELDAATKELSEVAAGGDPQMAPSSHFYVGMIQYTQEKYDAAKKSFETVIDTSGDPRLDEQAEQYLDRISTALAYKKMQENKWTLTGVVGAMYDSNVLLSPDNTGDQGSSTNISDFRLLTIGQVDYRPIMTEHHEFTPSVNASLTNSLKTEAAKADPFLYSFGLPYIYKGMLFNKGYRLTAKPVYEMLYMDPTGTGTKSMIFTSTYLVLDNTFVMAPNWFSSYSLEVRQDDSTTADSIGDDNADSGKYTIKTTQTVLTDKSKKEAVSGTLGYVLNAGKGKNKKYNRIDLGATYVKPFNWGEGASMMFGLTSYILKYPSATESRSDTNVTLTAGLSKPIKEWVTWGLVGSYTRNNSNLDANQYTKYMILTTATFTTMF